MIGVVDNAAPCQVGRTDLAELRAVAAQQFTKCICCRSEVKRGAGGVGIGEGPKAYEAVAAGKLDDRNAVAQVPAQQRRDAVVRCREL
jgi:hypothetical protein